MSLDTEFRVLLRDVVREIVREEIGPRPTALHTLNEVALNGIAKGSKVSQPLPQARLHSVIETLPVSEKAAASLVESRW